MSKQEHRIGVSEADLVKRHLKVLTKPGADIQAAIKDIDKIYGLDGVSFDEKTQIMNVAYDASQVCLNCIEDVLNDHNIDLGQDWWTHVKEEYYRFIDQNIKDNAQHEPWSCHKTPPHVRRKPKNTTLS